MWKIQFEASERQVSERHRMSTNSVKEFMILQKLVGESFFPHAFGVGYRELCHIGPPESDRSRWRVLTQNGPLEKGMANHSSILASDASKLCQNVLPKDSLRTCSVLSKGR